MKRHCLPLLLVLLCNNARAQSTDPPGLSLRMVVTPAISAWIGQHVAVTLIARTPVRFAGPVVFPDLVVGGRAIVLPNGASTPGVEREGNRTYAIVQHRFDLFPSETGALTIGPVAMTIPIAGEDGVTISQTAEAAAFSLGIRRPAGANDLTHLLTAPQAQLGAVTEGDPSRLPVGQAITRTVTLTASDTSAMLLPAMQWTAPAGMRVYPDPPRLTDGTDRGVLSAARVDRATFVPETPGRYVLPGASMQWFNPQDGTMTTLAVAPLDVVAVPVVTAGRVPWVLYLAVLTALALGCGGVWFLLTRNRLVPLEKAAYRRFRRACQGGDPALVAPAFYRWTAVAAPQGTPHTAAAVATAAVTPALAAEAAILAAACFGASRPTQPWNSHRLRSAVQTARSALRGRILRRAARHAALPGLNPPT